MAISIKKNFTSGPIFTPMLAFVLPIMLTNILQTMYNIADNVVVGKFSGDTLALAAVGASGALSALFLNFVVGLSAGASVVISHAYGAKDDEKVSRGVHTALTFGLFLGVGIGAVAFAFADKFLILMQIKPELLGRATLYLRIIFAALPATSVYNFAAAALRAVGDSRTSLYVLTVSGALNVVLNLVFVICFNMSVEGVALATAISKYASAIAVIIVLLKRKNQCYALHINKLRISKPMLVRMMRFGLPNGIQNSMFSISNILLTSAINTLETHVLSARTIAMNLTQIANNISASYTNAMLTFAGQNYGAKKCDRIKKSIFIGLSQSFAITLAIGMACYAFVDPISDLYIASSDPAREAIIESARSVCVVTLPFYCICSVMNVLSGTLRGIGFSLSPMMMSMFGICVFRSLWIFTAFNIPRFHSAQGLYLSYPISWLLVIIGLTVTLLIAWPRIKRETSCVGASIYEPSIRPM